MSEVTINGQDYLIGKLTARQQLNIAKRLTPVIQGLLPIWSVIQTHGRGDISDEQLAFQAAMAISNTISMLSDEASDYVMDLALGVIRFRKDGVWAPLRASNGSGLLMLEEADNLALQIRLLWEVLYANLANFSLETLLPPSLGLTLQGSTSLQ